MGTNLQNPDAEETDPEKILEFTRKPKQAPEYKPRSRSLSDLPGGIRVPILLKQRQRLQPKLQENLAGLEELKLLKEKQQQLIDSAKTLSVLKSNNQTEQSETTKLHLGLGKNF
ncbi:hypothetical protein KUTeg_011128 [Tegillarca granosa]|uniref:Uncharacterized protein n=1 Tax=Tegillarca granosa TaxID=220873 RepID=A0ABQ9F509_TEGGR|nr:hypothetical protein KUTeg_011128 [Tegillarca granosa]